MGQHGIQYILSDSYEAEEMTWTPSLAEEFKARCGYDLFPWLPVLTGEIVRSSEESERFLFDWLETIGELFAANYDRINDIVKEYGMKGRYTESHENGRVFVGDGMDVKMTAAVPMSAFWIPGTGGGSTLEMAQADIRESASVAHVYGQNNAAAESFTAAGLSDDPAEFDRLVADIWRSGRPNVFTGQLSNVLKAKGIAPDFRFVAPADLKFVHRHDGDREIYWIRNFSDQAVTADLTLRDADGPMKVYDPETGETLPGVLSGNQLKMEANQALFVVSDRKGESEPEYVAPVHAGRIVLDGPWAVTFDGLAAPEGPRTFPELASYTDSDEPAVKYFSGIATYTNTFTLGKREKADGLSIDLGTVGQMADVFVNGEHVRFLWKAPYKVEWSGKLNPGKNTITVKVVNTWPNRLIGDAQPGAEKVTYTTMPFYRAGMPLTPSGLMGPVVLEKLISIQ